MTVPRKADLNMSQTHSLSPGMVASAKGSTPPFLLSLRQGRNQVHAIRPFNTASSLPTSSIHLTKKRRLMMKANNEATAKANIVVADSTHNKRSKTKVGDSAPTDKYAQPLYEAKDVSKAHSGAVETSKKVRSTPPVGKSLGMKPEDRSLSLLGPPRAFILPKQRFMHLPSAPALLKVTAAQDDKKGFGKKDLGERSPTSTLLPPTPEHRSPPARRIDDTFTKVILPHQVRNQKMQATDCLLFAASLLQQHEGTHRSQGFPTHEPVPRAVASRTKRPYECISTPDEEKKTAEPTSSPCVSPQRHEVRQQDLHPSLKHLSPHPTLPYSLIAPAIHARAIKEAGESPTCLKPQKMDVLCGRGGLINKHPGNIVYRRVVEHNKPFYQSVQKRHRILVSQSIVLSIEKLGGRFLTNQHSLKPKGRGEEADDSDADSKSSADVWMEIDFRRAVQKTSQALRERTVSSTPPSTPDFGRRQLLVEERQACEDEEEDEDSNDTPSCTSGEEANSDELRTGSFIKPRNHEMLSAA